MPDSARGNARYRRILRFAARQLAVTWWYEIALPRIGLRRITERTRTRRMQRFAHKFRALAVDLGGLMIKLGQFMSSRLDVLPPEFTKELEGLQDEVPPVPFEAIRELAEAELDVPLEKVYAHIDADPVAAASLGQAYRAHLGEQDAADAGFSAVVIKVQRPGIEQIVDVDLAALRRVGGWLSRVKLISRRADMPALIEEFATTSLQEIDYLHEGVNAERFTSNFAEDARVRAPAVVWERTTRRVLTLEDVTAIKITDLDSLREADIDPVEVAHVFAEVMFDQFFIHGFFHADPHPGNLFVTPGAQASAGSQDLPPWTLTFIDFGMMGEVPPMLRTTLRALIIAAAQRDGRGMVQAMRSAGVLLPTADTQELEQAMTQVFDRFGGMGFAELRELDPREFRDFALEFSDVLLSLPFQLPENLLLLFRAGSLTSGVASSLEPTYNLWDSVEPYAGQLLRDEGGNMLRDVGQQAWQVAGTVWRLPGRVDELITRAEQGSLAVTTPRLERSVNRLERTGGRVVTAVLGGALLIAGAIVRPDDATLGTVFMVAAALPGLHALLAGRFR